MYWNRYQSSHAELFTSPLTIWGSNDWAWDPNKTIFLEKLVSSICQRIPHSCNLNEHQQNKVTALPLTYNDLHYKVTYQDVLVKLDAWIEILKHVFSRYEAMQKFRQETEEVSGCYVL